MWNPNVYYVVAECQPKPIAFGPYAERVDAEKFRIAHVVPNGIASRIEQLPTLAIQATWWILPAKLASKGE